MHADDHSAHIMIYPSAFQYALQPVHLLRIKLIFAGIVQIDEVNAALYPVIVGVRLVIALFSTLPGSFLA